MMVLIVYGMNSGEQWITSTEISQITTVIHDCIIAYVGVLALSVNI